MGKRRRPVCAVSIGCAAGVGPEVSVVGAARVYREIRCVLVGDGDALRRAATLRRVSKRRLVTVGDAAAVASLEEGQIGVWRQSTALRKRVSAGKPTKEAGAAQLAWIDEATKLVSHGICDALVTAPVSKAAIVDSGARGAKHFRGHTEHLKEALQASEAVMAFCGPKLATALVTTHIPLARVSKAVTPAAVATTCFWLSRLLDDLDKAGDLVVAALNPHAGEAGILGGEEERVIGPGIVRARRRLKRAGIGRKLVGPMGAETAFRRSVFGDFAGVVAMYHDQATIPSKLLGFGDAVNVTLGLPMIRTSVDHGTAYDVAGSGRASARGMREALRLAAVLVAAKR